MENVVGAFLTYLHSKKTITLQDYKTLSNIINKDQVNKVSEQKFPTKVNLLPFKNVRKTALAQKVDTMGSDEILIEFSSKGITDQIINDLVINGNATKLIEALEYKGVLTIYISDNIFKQSVENIQKTLNNLIDDSWKMFKNDLTDPLLKEVSQLGIIGKDLLTKTNLRLLFRLAIEMMLVTDNAKIDANSATNTMNNDSEDMKLYFTLLRDILAKNEKINKDKYMSLLHRVIDSIKAYSNIGTNYSKLITAMEDYFNGKFDTTIKECFEKIYQENCEDAFYMIERKTYKKLKKIPSDLIAYITIEGENTKDANDKMMIVSYAYGKLEIVEWYIELIDTGSKDYLVPHSRQYLTTVRIQLLDAIKKIMSIKIDPNRPLIDIRYPKGYEG